MNDTQIVELYLQRDKAAITHTAEAYGQQLRQLSYSIVGDHQAAEACEHDTYLQAWDSIPLHKPRTDLYAFLARITRRLSIDQCRQTGQQAVTTELSAELESCIHIPDDTPCRLDPQRLADAISRFLKTLPETRRHIFLRRYWFADSIEDIAKRYHMTQRHVKSSLTRTRSALQTYLRKAGFLL